MDGKRLDFFDNLAEIFQGLSNKRRGAMAGKICRIAPHSRQNKFLKLDGRTQEAAIMRRARRDLIAHLGGQPSAVQMRLIDRAAMLTLHVDLFDRRAIRNGGLSERDSRSYLAYSNSLARTLARLGPQPAVTRVPSLAEAMASGKAIAV